LEKKNIKPEATRVILPSEVACHAGMTPQTLVAFLVLFAKFTSGPSFVAEGTPISHVKATAANYEVSASFSNVIFHALHHTHREFFLLIDLIFVSSCGEEFLACLNRSVFILSNHYFEPSGFLAYTFECVYTMNSEGFSSCHEMFLTPTASITFAITVQVADLFTASPPFLQRKRPAFIPCLKFQETSPPVRDERPLSTRTQPKGAHARIPAYNYIHGNSALPRLRRPIWSCMFNRKQPSASASIKKFDHRKKPLTAHRLASETAADGGYKDSWLDRLLQGFLAKKIHEVVGNAPPQSRRAGV
jgi:hypothetical protein